MIQKIYYANIIRFSINYVVACVPLILIFSSKSSVLLLSVISALIVFLAYLKDEINFLNIFSYVNNNLLLNFVLLFIIYAGLSNFWSLSPKQGMFILTFEFIVPIIFLSLALSVNDEILSSIDITTCLYGFVIAGIVLVFETKSNMMLRHIIGARQWTGALGHAGVTLALLSPVIFVFLSYRAPHKAYVFLSIISACLMIILNDASKLALIGFLVTYFLYSRWIKALNMFLFVMLAIYIFLQPWIWSFWGADLLSKSILGFKSSAIHRLHIWETFSNLSLLNPWHGYGIASGHVLYKFEDIVSMLPASLHEFVDVWHPHNNYLEIWLDLGFFGIVFFVLCMWQIFRGQWIAQRGHFSSLIAIILIGACSHGFWQGWWISAVCMVILLYRIIDAKYKNNVRILEIVPSLTS